MWLSWNLDQFFLVVGLLLAGKQEVMTAAIFLFLLLIPSDWCQFIIAETQTQVINLAEIWFALNQRIFSINAYNKALKLPDIKCVLNYFMFSRIWKLVWKSTQIEHNTSRRLNLDFKSARVWGPVYEVGCCLMVCKKPPCVHAPSFTLYPITARCAATRITQDQYKSPPANT